MAWPMLTETGISLGLHTDLEEGEDLFPAGQGEELGLHTDGSDVHIVPGDALEHLERANMHLLLQGFHTMMS